MRSLTRYVFRKCVGVPEVDVGAIDTFFNLTNCRTQLMNKEVPWSNGQEKELKSLQAFVEAFD